MGSCGACKNDISDDGDFSTCGHCKVSYHFKCSISEQTWRGLSSNKKKEWMCAPCRKKKGDGEGTGNNSSTPDNANQQKINSIEKLLEKKFAEQEKKMSEFTERMEKKFDKKFKDMETSLNFLHETVTDLTKSVKEIEKNNVIMNTKYEKIDGQTKQLQAKVKGLETYIHDMDQKALSAKLEISGFPHGVDDERVVRKVMEKITIDPPIQRTDYVIQSRPAPRNNEKPKPIVVTYRSEQMRNAIMKKVKQDKPNIKVKSIIQGGEDTPVFINESLTPHYKKVFFEAKKLKSQKNYAFLWVTEGKILLKTSQDGRAIKINSVEDVEKL